MSSTLLAYMGELSARHLHRVCNQRWDQDCPAWLQTALAALLGSVLRCWPLFCVRLQLVCQAASGTAQGAHMFVMA